MKQCCQRLRDHSTCVIMCCTGQSAPLSLVHQGDLSISWLSAWVISGLKIQIKYIFIRSIIMSVSKHPKAPLTSTHGFHTHLAKWHFNREETRSWNQRHGSIIHSYYKNTASKDTFQITISEGCAFSTSSKISQTQTRTQKSKNRKRENVMYMRCKSM